MKKLLVCVMLILLSWTTMEIYCRSSDEFIVNKIKAPTETKTLILLFHGARDQLNPELESLSEQFKHYLAKSQNIKVLNYNWSFASDNRFRASTNAIKIGENLGKEISSLNKLKNIRLISHSAGAFIPDALCRAYRENGGKAHIEMNFLDPFSLRGFTDVNFGVYSHGKCADFASSIINTDDPAPTTNKHLKYAWNIDVTNIKKPKNLKRNGHYWPPLYFLLSLNKDTAKIGIRSHEEYPRGDILIAEN